MVKWALLARQFLSRQSNDFLQQAILEAKKIDEIEITDYLQAFANGNIGKVDRLAEQLIPKLNHSNRSEEALTINLLVLHTRAVETYSRYEYKKQKTAREVGIQSCQQAIQVSQILNDKPCQAIYSGKLASGFASSRQLPEAEYFNKQALQLYRDCALQKPDIFMKYVAKMLNNLGKTQYTQRKLREAETAIVEALKIYQKLAEAKPHIFLRFVAMSLNNLGKVQNEQRNLADAEASYTEAAKIYQGLDKKKPNTFLRSVAFTLNNLGAVQRAQRKLTEAETSYSKVLKIRKKLAETEPHVFLQGVAQTLNSLGNTYWEKRKMKEAESSYTEALEIYQKLAEKEPLIFMKSVAKTLNNLGNTQYNQRKLREAEISIIGALEICQKLAETEPHIFLQDVATALNNLGNVQREQRKPREAETSFVEALEIRRKLAETDSLVFLQDLAMTLNNLGAVQNDQQKLKEAEISYSKSLEIRRKLVETEPHIFLQDLAMSLNNLGIMQYDQRRLREAETSFVEALEIYKKLAETEPHVFLQNVAMTLSNLGAMQIDQKKLREAETSIVEVLKIRRKLAETEPHIFLQEVAMSLNNLGNVQYEQDKLDVAKENYESARGLLEDLRAKAITIDDRNRILQALSLIYSNLLDCYIEMKDWKKTLEIAELGKSRSLSDLLDLKSEDLQPKAPTSNSSTIVRNLGRKYSAAIKELQRLESYERYLSEQLSQFENTIKQIKDSKEIDDAAQKESLRQMVEEKQLLELEKQKARNQRFAKQSELKSVLDGINNYDKDFPPKAKEISNEEIIGISKSINRTIVIFRVLLQSTAIIFVFPDGSLQVETAPNFGQDELFRLFHDDWLIPYQNWKKDHKMPTLKDASWQVLPSSQIKTKDWIASMERNLKTIYKKLMIHVHRILKEKSPTKEILFIPSQSLAVLPLHAASWKDKNGEIRYLLEEFTISYCPSVSVFKRCQENEKSRTDRTLLITNPTGDLIFSEKETESIKTFHQPSMNLPGKKATKSAVIKALRDDYSFTHFACHGFYHLENQFDSGLVMADQVIKLSEIINCHFQNNWLTTLSACETGMVDFASPTDEHFGLPLGFIFAGSPSIWASLWSVSDETTSLLMQDAYQNLSKEEFHNNKPEALRQAQLSTLRKFSHPYYWAGFQHYGI